MAIDVISDFKRRALARVGLENIDARLADGRKIRNLNAVAGSGVIASLAGLSLQNNRAAANGTHRELRGRSAQGGKLRRACKISELIEYDGTGLRG
jgi:hypothetical protein